MDFSSAGIPARSKKVLQNQVMIEKLVDSIIMIQLRMGTIKKDDIKVYRYGYTLMIEVFLNIVVSLTVSIMLGKVKEYAVVVCVFIPLRSFCGGYHAKEAWKCVILSNGSIIIAIMFAMYMELHINLSFWYFFVADVALGIIIMYLSPIESLNNRLSNAQRQIYKKYAGVIFIIEMLVGVLCYLTHHQKFSFLMMNAHCIQTFSLIVEKIFRMKRREKVS